MISKAWHCNAGFVIADTKPSRIARFALPSHGATSAPHAYQTTSNRHAIIDRSAGDEIQLRLLRQEEGFSNSATMMPLDCKRIPQLFGCGTGTLYPIIF
jgi:hypothetical protein